MSYATGEAALLAVLRTHANYNSRNTSRADWTIVAQGGDRYVIFRQGAITRRRLSFDSVAVTWQTVLVVMHRFEKNTSVTEQGLQADVQIIADLFDRYPYANQGQGQGVTTAMVTRATDTQAVFEGQRPQYLTKELFLDWEEDTGSISFAE